MCTISSPPWRTGLISPGLSIQWTSRAATIDNILCNASANRYDEIRDRLSMDLEGEEYSTRLANDIAYGHCNSGTFYQWLIGKHIPCRIHIGSGARH